MLANSCLPHKVKDFNCALKAYTKVTKMLGNIYIDNYDDVKIYIEDSTLNNLSSKDDVAQAFSLAYKSAMKQFYDASMESFLTGASEGDGETFYVHTITFYMPGIIDNTYMKHKLGSGIWSMEGFEYKNAQSKRAVYTHSNRRGNLPAQSLVHLYLIFTMGQHEQKKKKKEKNTVPAFPTMHENTEDIRVEAV